MKMSLPVLTPRVPQFPLEGTNVTSSFCILPEKFSASTMCIYPLPLIFFYTQVTIYYRVPAFSFNNTLDIVLYQIIHSS